MSRVTKVRGAWMTGLCATLLALSALAADKAPPPGGMGEKDPFVCREACSRKANTFMSTCTPRCQELKNASKDDAALTCMHDCAQKLESIQSACQGSCPAPKPTPTPTPAPKP